MMHAWELFVVVLVVLGGCGSPSPAKMAIPDTNNVTVHVTAGDFRVLSMEGEFPVSSFFDPSDRRLPIEQWAEFVRTAQAASLRRDPNKPSSLSLMIEDDARWWGKVEEVAYAFVVAVGGSTKVRLRLATDKEWIDLPIVRRDDTDLQIHSIGIDTIRIFFGARTEPDRGLSISSPDLRIFEPLDFGESALGEIALRLAKRCPENARPADGWVSAVSVTYKVGTDKTRYLAKDAMSILRMLYDGRIGCIDKWEVVPFSWR